MFVVIQYSNVLDLSGSILSKSEANHDDVNLGHLLSSSSQGQRGRSWRPTSGRVSGEYVQCQITDSVTILCDFHVG